MVLSTRSSPFAARATYQVSHSVALAAALAVNIAALLLLSLVGDANPVGAIREVRTDPFDFEWIVPRTPLPVPEMPIAPKRPEAVKPQALSTPKIAPITTTAPVDASIVNIETGTETYVQPSESAPGDYAAPAGLPDALPGYDQITDIRYPRIGLARGMEGTVTLLVLVGADGRIEQIKVESSSGHSVLDQHALRQVRERWTFRAAVRNGQPVAAWVSVPVDFRLDRY